MQFPCFCCKFRLKRNVEHVILKPLSYVFQSWTGPEKLLALDELIDSCEPTQVKHMMQVIEPQFQRDFISLLPKEVSPQIPFFTVINSQFRPCPPGPLPPDLNSHGNPPWQTLFFKKHTRLR